MIYDMYDFRYLKSIEALVIVGTIETEYLTNGEKYMIYVEILGRMGNQMFSYAFARKLQNVYSNQDIAFDFTNFEYRDDTWINYMDKFSCSDNVKLEYRKMNIIQKLVLKVYFMKKNKLLGKVEVKSYEDKYADIMEIFGIYMYTTGYHEFRYRSLFKNKLVMGFYESSKYFDDIKGILMNDFSIAKIGENTKRLSDEIARFNSIAVGVRRGDFLSSDNIVSCDVCTPLYYESGIKVIYNKLENLGLSNIKVFFFTDDIEWTKSNIKCDIQCEYVTSSINGQLKPWEMMYLMSLCKYHVISNSSFFWWGQYLNNSNDKLVVAPSKWRNINSDIYSDIYQEGWIRIE